MLTAEALAAHNAGTYIADDGEAALRVLLDQEASMARREHMIALQREYLQLQALSPAEASGWHLRL